MKIDNEFLKERFLKQKMQDDLRDFKNTLIVYAHDDMQDELDIKYFTGKIGNFHRFFLNNINIYSEEFLKDYDIFKSQIENMCTTKRMIKAFNDMLDYQGNILTNMSNYITIMSRREENDGENRAN